MKRVYPATVLMCSAFALSACATVGKSGRTIDITSAPGGAAVLASGVEIGRTPLTIHPDEVFPPRFVGLGYRAAGTLTVQKEGCEPNSRQVNDAVLREDIHVRLQCAPGVAAKPTMAAPAGMPATEADKGTRSAGQRLREVEKLKSEGLINDDEYRRLRRRILDEI